MSRIAEIPDFNPEVGVKIPASSTPCAICGHLKLPQGWERFPICKDCLKALKAVVAEQHELDSKDISKMPPFDPEATAHYEVSIGGGLVFAVPNPETHYDLFCDVIRKLGRGEYREMFSEAPV